MWGSGDFPGNDRFQVAKRLGTGGMGVVYEVLDRERGMRVALKTLQTLSADAVLRFKNEFRALQDLSHPNLVTLGELIGQDGHLFFTMELVEGEDFLTWVRPGRGPALDPPTRQLRAAGGPASPPAENPGRCDLTHLRPALVQLARGLAALHEAHKVHRDIKPSNVMVTRSGRVVLLDFGLATDTRDHLKSDSGHVVGTADYMAPEQAASKPAGPEADLYSTGVMLFEALTGRLPFDGPPLTVLMTKLHAEPPRPSLLDPEVPSDLDQLCFDLLRLDPLERPTAADLLARLGAGQRAGAGAAQRATTSLAPVFVGRRRELAVLRQAFEESREGRPASVLISGQSGLGKSALLRTFADTLADECPDALVLAGRCYERESVPFKAFDGVIGALSRHLGRIDQIAAALLLPRDAALVAQIFPALRRIPAMSRVPEPRQIPDPQALRTVAFAAVRELLTRLCERSPVVVMVDDFQWADADSRALLADILHPLEPVRLLAVAAMRGDSATGPGLAAFPGRVVELVLPALSSAESQQLAEGLLAQSSRDQRSAAAGIAAESGGHPLFLQELVRHAAAAQGTDRSALRLDDALWARVCSLDPAARRLVEVVAVAGTPLGERAAAQAAGLDGGEIAKCVAALRVAHLLRGGQGSTDSLEAYHDRVGEAVRAHLSPEVRREHHRALAGALEGAGAAHQDPQILVRHLEAAGEDARAATLAERAAQRSREALAFDQAAELYLTALRLGRFDAADQRRLRVGLGDALANAGRGPEAAEAYLAALPAADAATRLDCQRKAAEQLLISGHIERGLETLSSVLADVGVEAPRTSRRALVSLLWTRARLGLRGLRWKPRDESQISPQDLTRLDVFRAASLGLGMVDNIRGADFQARGLLLSLKTGERRRIGRALFFEAVFLSTQGSPRAAKLLAEGQRIAEESRDAYLLAFAAGCRGSLALFGCRFREADEWLAKAELQFRENTTGTSYEQATTRLFRLQALRHLGNYHELRRGLEAHLREAARRGDRYFETTLVRACNSVWLAQDDPDRATEELAQRSWTAPEGGYHLQHWYELRARAEIDLYRGDAGAALTRATQELAVMQRALLMRLQMVRAEAVWIKGRLLLAAAERAAPGASPLQEVRAVVRSLEREGIGFADAWGLLTRGGLARLSGDEAAAVADLRAAVAAAESADMGLVAAVARRRLGELLGGDEGRALATAADDWMTANAIARPHRMAALLAPGFGVGP